MANTAPNINGFLYDAMSGFFVPPTDPEKRQHTLARLMLGAISKGQRGDDYSWVYRPEWAPLTVTAWVTPTSLGKQALQLTPANAKIRGLEVGAGTLGNTGKRGLQVITLEEERPQLVLDPKDWPLEHGDGYAERQERVTSIAQDFFDSLAVKGNI